MSSLRRIARVAALAECLSPALSTIPTTLLGAILTLLPTNAAGADLIVEPVDVARISALSQNRVAWQSAANDLGEVADDLQLSHLTVVLKRSAQQQLAFEDFLRQQRDPSSPHFQHWLTPVEVGEAFGASLRDINMLTTWLRSQGLEVDSVANSRVRIDFSGTAAQVGAAFATRLHSYDVNGERRMAPAGVPQIPAALSAIVQSVRGLSTVNERPNHGAGKTLPFVQRSALDSPAATNCSGSVCFHTIFPADFAKIYDVNPVYQQGIDGTGQTIAVIGTARVYLPDIENFQSQARLATKDPVIVVPPGGIDPGPALSSGGNPPAEQTEATIDVARATSVAPGATIKLFISGSTSTFSGPGFASVYVVENNLAQIMTLSFSVCEADAGQAFVDAFDSLFSQAAMQGISVFVSSGDTGAAGCDPHSATSTTPPATQIASANANCASSYVTCVGGTEFADTANPSAFWSSSNGFGFESALGYIPEGAWNEPLNGNSPQASASGGGVSSYIPTPAWQTGPGVPGKQGRYTPDVAFSASSHNAYFVCLAAAGASCVVDNTGHFRAAFYGGTSVAAPSMAGVAALLNQKMGSTQGNLNPRLYALAATPGNAVFHDVTVATSGVSGCDLSVPSMCNNSTPGQSGLSGGLQGYLVGPGYDEVTGLGSIDVANLLSQWSSGPPTATTPAVEYYYSAWNFYFESAFPAEIAALDGGAFGGAWQRTGEIFNVWPQAAPGSSPTCRFFSTAFAPKSSHFYTPFPSECAIVKTEPAWQYEAIAFYIQLADANGFCGPGTIPLYRAYNNGMGGAPNHRYTTSQTILNQMLAAGWVFEGNGNTQVFACVPQ